MAFVIERVANEIFISDGCGQVWKSWDEEDFTERKLNNAIKSIKKNFNCEVVFENRL